MEPTSYLEALIEHVVSQVENASHSPTAMCARATVEGAAAALAAFGLLASDDVTGFVEQTDAALERKGLVQRISVERSQHVDAEMWRQSSDDRVAKRQKRNLESVVPVGVEAQLPDGSRLILLSINRWNVGFDIMCALLDDPGTPRDAFHGEWQWTIVDDAGLKYECQTGGASGGREALWLRAHGRPPLRRTANRLEIQLDRNSVRLLSTTVHL